MLHTVAEVVLEVAGGATGHVVLWTLTLGRWKAFEQGHNLATVVGLLTWVGITVGLAKLLQ